MRRIRNLNMLFIALGFALAVKSVTGGLLVPTSIAPALPGTMPVSPGPGVFLVAKRDLDGSHFGQTVVYLVDHDEAGTLGLIVNRSSDINLHEALPGIEVELSSVHALHYGGPVGLPAILMLLRSETASEGMAHVDNGIYVSADRRILEKVLAVKKPVNEVHFYIGYSGWSAGQLDAEIERGSWHVVAADSNAIFSAESDRLWYRLIEQLEPKGIQVDNRQLSPGPAIQASRPARRSRV